MDNLRHIIVCFVALAALAWLALGCSEAAEAPAPTEPPAASIPVAAPTERPAQEGTVRGEVTTEGLPPLLEKEEAERIAKERLEAHKPYDWGAPGTLDPEAVGNPYVFEGLGVSLERPQAWTWLAATSCPGYATLTSHGMRLQVNPGHWADPFRTPLIATAPTSAPIAGRDPALRVFVRPLDGPWGMFESFFGDAQKVVKQEVDRARADHPDGFEVIEAPALASHSGIDGAYARLGYDVPGHDGGALGVEETIWYLPRPPYLFFVRISKPATASEDVTHAIDAAFTSLEIVTGGAG